MTTITNLAELYNAMRSNDEATLDQHGQWRSDLPTFGGPTPDCTFSVWSWDHDRIIIGSCRDDLEIVARDSEI